MSDKREIDSIIIHCSDSVFGDAEEIRRWHTDPKPRGRGWDDIGYHYVILNGVKQSGDDYDLLADGIIEIGRPVHIPGAHCRGHNKRSIGICLIGTYWFSARQLLIALPKLIEILRDEHPHISSIKGHRQYNHMKSCPNMDVPVLIEALNITI